MAYLKKNRARGKRAQREIAKLLGGENVGTLGGVDILCDDFIVEVKDFSRFAGEKILEQVEKHKQKWGKKALGIVHIRQERYENSIVLMRLCDFIDILEKKG